MDRFTILSLTEYFTLSCTLYISLSRKERCEIKFVHWMLTLCDLGFMRGDVLGMWTSSVVCLDCWEKKVENNRTYEWVYNIAWLLIASWLWASCLPFLRDSGGAMGPSSHPEHFGSGPDSATTSWVTLTKELDFRNLCFHVSIMGRKKPPGKRDSIYEGELWNRDLDLNPGSATP